MIHIYRCVKPLLLYTKTNLGSYHPYKYLYVLKLKKLLEFSKK